MKGNTWLKAMPTYLTWSRLVAVPVMFLVYTVVNEPMAWVVFCFVLASLTDWLDGFIAKRYDCSTRFGAFLDPVADKLLVSSALIIMVAEHPKPYMAIIASIIIGREILISALREWMSAVGERMRVNVIRVAQIKTVFQVIGIALVLGSGFYSYCFIAGLSVLGAAVLLTVYSMVMYLLASRHSLIEVDS